jgi:hypothetical protein
MKKEVKVEESAGRSNVTVQSNHGFRGRFKPTTALHPKREGNCDGLKGFI